MLSFLLALSAVVDNGAWPRTACVEADSAGRAGLYAALEGFSAAFRDADHEALETLLVASYMHTNGGTGQVLTRDEWLEYVRGRRADLENGRLRVHTYETSDVRIRWCSGAAVVSSQIRSEGIHNGRAFQSRLRVTQLWLRVGGRWRRAAFHDSPIQAP